MLYILLVCYSIILKIKNFPLLVTEHVSEEEVHVHQHQWNRQSCHQNEISHDNTLLYLINGENSLKRLSGIKESTLFIQRTSLLNLSSSREQFH